MIFDEISVPKIVVISESPGQRLAFGQAIKSMGYCLLGCIPSNRLLLFKDQKVDLWLIDSDDDISIIEQLSTEDQYLLGFTSSPNITDVKAFDKWQRHLKRKLVYLFNDEDKKILTSNKAPLVSAKSLKKSWHRLIVIGASMGGPEAVKKFLDDLPVTLPVTIVIAQHTDDVAVQDLSRILTLHNDWKCEVVRSNSQLVAGKVWLLPPEHEVVFHPSGWLLCTENQWGEYYKPSISKTMTSASKTFTNKVLHIIFSGMGDDGADVSAFAKSCNSQIWVQSPESCKCDSQTTAMISKGDASFIGSPNMLARYTVNYMKNLN